MSRAADKSSLQPTVDPLEARRRRREEREKAAAAVVGGAPAAAPVMIEQSSHEHPVRAEASQGREGDSVTAEAAAAQEEAAPAVPVEKPPARTPARRASSRTRPAAAEADLPMPASKEPILRVSVSTRLRADLNESLQQFVQDHRVKTQDTLDLAVEEFLTRRGYPPANR